MKSVFIAFFMFFMTQAYGDIEFDGKLDIPSDKEVSQNRACFEELAKLGCGDPGDDHQQFRSCMHDVYPSLTDDCRKMMTGLYKRKG